MRPSFVICLRRRTKDAKVFGAETAGTFGDLNEYRPGKRIEMENIMSRSPMNDSYPLFDAHNHLQDIRFSADIAEVLHRARGLGVTYDACCGTNPDDWSAVETLASGDRRIVPSFGLHPWYLEQRTEDWLEILEAFLKRNPGAGVGEIGLDHALATRRDEEQAAVVQSQLALARRLDRPVSIHCRRAWAAILHELNKAGPLSAGFVVHAYSGSLEFVELLCARGGYISFSGSLTHPRNRRARACCVAVPEDRLLIETDAPDMMPLIAGRPPSANGRNEPGNLVVVLETVARCRERSMSRIAELTMRNARRLFRVP